MLSSEEFGMSMNEKAQDFCVGTFGRENTYYKC
jgi:hypothetical protein